MRTIDEIVAKARDTSRADLFGTKVGDIIEWLPFDRAREWLKETATADDWAKAGFPRPLTNESVVQEIVAYMPFAWDKANNNRGLSAGRSICHMQAWLWLLGADEAAETIENYRLYGKPQLRSICEALGINWQALDDGRWTDTEDGDGAGPIAGPDLKFPHLETAS
jgi:hypothetical protein